MKRKGAVVFTLAAIVLMLGRFTEALPTKTRLQSVGNNEPASLRDHRLTMSAKDGTGPVCWPGIGCGYR